MAVARRATGQAHVRGRRADTAGLGLPYPGRALSAEDAKLVIDPASGCLRFDGGALITPELSRSAFLTAPWAAIRKLSVENEPWCSWRVTGLEADGRRFIVVLYFYAERLRHLEIVQHDPTAANGWDNWSEEHELLMKVRYEGFLTDELGGARTFSWGSAQAVYDPKSGGSFIYICYGAASG